MATIEPTTGQVLLHKHKELANTALSNLASVAINTSLISDTDSTDDLGSSSKYWANGYIDNLATPLIINNAKGTGALTVRGNSDDNLFYVNAVNNTVNVNATGDPAGWAKVYITGGGTRFDDDFRFGKGSGTQYVTRYPTGSTGYNLEFQVRSACVTMYGAGGIVINEDGIAENDFRVEGDTQPSLIATDASIDGLGFYGATPTAQQTGVAVTAAAIHAALVNLGLITA